MANPGRFEVVLDPDFTDDLRYWIANHPKTARRVFALAEAAMTDPARGIGKPEPVARGFIGVWSRRIDQEHRLLYRVVGQRIYFLQARYHYQS